MFDFLSSISFDQLTTVVYHAIRAIRLGKSILDIQSILKTGDQKRECSSNERELVSRIINQIEHAERVNLAQLTDAKAEEYIRILAMIVEDRARREFELDKQAMQIPLEIRELWPLDPKVVSKKLGHCEVYLDSNLILPLLGLESDHIVGSARERIDLLKKYGFDIKAFSFTLEELHRVLTQVSVHLRKLPVELLPQVGLPRSIQEAWVVKGWRQQEITDFIENLDTYVHSTGITIELVPNKNLSTYEPFDEKLRGSLARYKDPTVSTVSSVNHDLAAIETIIEIRGKPITRIEDIKAFFLTQDIRLSKFNVLEMGHWDNFTVPEVFLDKLLADILWLKDPDTQPSLPSILEAYSRQLFVDIKVWDKFSDVVRELRKEGKVKDQHLEEIFLGQYMAVSSGEWIKPDVDEISEDFLVDVIAAARSKERLLKISPDQKEGEIARVEHNSTLQEISMKEHAERVRLQMRIEESKHSLSEHSKREATKAAILYCSLLTIIIMGMAYGIYFAFGQLDIAGYQATLISVLFSVIGILPLWTKFRSWIEFKLYKLKLQKKLWQTKLG